MLNTPRLIEDFFDRFVCQPFHRHAETSGWKEEVLSRPHDWRHRTCTILERGRTDFDAPYKNLTPAEKVTIYCYQYMQKHTASTCYVFDAGAKLGLADADDWIVLDFGSGPATLAVALAQLKAQGGQSIHASAKPLLNYIGIERSKAMREKAKSVARESGLFHGESDFVFGKSFDDANGIFSHIDTALPAIEINAFTLVLNFSYFFSSKFLNVRDVATFVKKLQSRYVQYPIWLVYQNPDHSGFRSPWEKFKRELHGFKSIKRSSTKMRYPNTTNMGEVDSFVLDYELMSHRAS